MVYVNDPEQIRDLSLYRPGERMQMLNLTDTTRIRRAPSNISFYRNRFRASTRRTNMSFNCAVLNCSKNGVHGAHVRLRTMQDSEFVFIVPMCALHNNGVDSQEGTVNPQWAISCRNVVFLAVRDTRQEAAPTSAAGDAGSNRGDPNTGRGRRSIVSRLKRLLLCASNEPQD